MTIRSFFPILGLLLSACGNAPDPQQQAEALLNVAEAGDVTAIERLLGEQTDVNARNSCDWTPLMKAAVNGHVDAVARLLDAGADVDAIDQGGYTALLLAASNDHVAVVEQLLARGAMIDAQEQTQGYTPLIWAAHRGHRAAVEHLLAHGADPTLPDLEAQTAADHARRQGHAEIQQMLDTATSDRLTERKG